MAFDGDKTCKRRSSRLGRPLERITGLGPRNIVFSTLAFTGQACVTTQSRAARTRIFGGQHGKTGWIQKKGDAFSHVGYGSSIGHHRAVFVRLLW